MSITSHLETAEEAVRQSLINALAEGEDQYLTDLFNLLNHIRDMNKKVSNTIRYTDNTSEWQRKWGEYNFNLSSDYLNNPDTISFGGDTVIKFPVDKVNLGLE